MMKLKDIKTLLLAGFVCCGINAALTSCESELDEVPDNRTEIDTPEKVQLLLVSGYPQAVPAVMCELFGDNYVDNNVVKPGQHRAAYKDFHDEAYAWQNVNNYSTGDDDTPYQVWEAYYQGIAVANHAIDAMRKISPNPAADPELAHSWGEAHVLRAYLHFTLVNVFAEAYKDDAQSAADRGIPYVTEPEQKVNVNYGDGQFLHSVKETYDLIEKDMLTGINLIDDSKYKVPAYHFNKNAANAFAARFYLYKRNYAKVIEYADAALGNNAASSLRKWASINTNTINSMLNSYNDETAACNFLLQSAYSLQDRLLSAIRYVCNDGNSAEKVKSSKNAVYGSGPNWSNRLPAYDGKIYRFGENDDGSWLFRVYEYFEYDDKIAGIGWVHMIYQPFTAEETLLCRAEAKLYLGDQTGAIADLDTWTKSKQVSADLTLSGITRWYSSSKTPEQIETDDYISDLHPADMSPEFKVLTGDDLSVLYCVLHFRRIETMFEGLRWFDIKRYGITVHHAYRGPRDANITHDYLKWNDKRRVMQIPNNVINAGYPSTDRATQTNMSSPMTQKPQLAN
ncbi:MAG: RagB/SusD family nutrient uptake outer membrane protein [Prevotella sp.]|nr:RagB/SusD family nutrient uptake outer membrane protein [Prevotella sp.]